MKRIMLRVGVWLLAIAAAGCDGGGAPEPGEPVCGNARRELGEVCDDGNAADGDGCDNNCTRTECGNGVRSMDEGCDDGNRVYGDGCDNNCMVTGCGNGFATAPEQCDDGNSTSGDGCDNNCKLTGCGNGVLTAGEACDDGNRTSGDGCDASCTVTACGNGVVTGAEVCDDGNDVSGDGCDTNCKPTGCGNGVLTAGEACDDGNYGSGDGCDSNCKPTGCGNGVLTAGEVCDDGNDGSGDGCDANCTVTACGNAILTAPELCDDGNTIDGDGCDSNCTSGCGNGIATGAEECDDGNSTSGDGCDANCTMTACGNGVRTAPEQCDDANDGDGDGCDGNCTLTACGNGVVTGAEECDDGNSNNLDGCTNACILQVCGDGQLDAPEDCDDGNTASGDGCDANCTATACGNGVVTAGEACDDGNTKSLDGCSALCVIEPLEVEPNEDGSISSGAPGIAGNDFAIAKADANGAFTGPVVIRAAIAPVGDEDVFKFTNPTSQLKLLRLDTWDPALGIGAACGTSKNTGLQLRAASGAVLASNDDRDASNRCSFVSYLLAPGASVYAHVMESGDDAAIGAYVLRALYDNAACGNGALSLAEQCDDGNTLGGDGCSATCQVETTAEAEPNNTFSQAATSPLQITGDVTIRGSHSSFSDTDVFRLVVGTPTVIRFETFRSIYDCSGDDLDLQLYDAAGLALVTDQDGLGAGPCGAIVFFLASGTYFLRVPQSYSSAATPYFLEVDYQLDRGAESEPASASGGNDNLSTASSNLLGGSDVVVFGDHTLVSDVDVYAITVPGGARIRAELIEGDRTVKSCESGITSWLTLVDDNWAWVAEDYSSGRGGCSLIDGTGSQPLHSAARNTASTPRTFYLVVREGSFSTSSSFTYRLQVSVR